MAVKPNKKGGFQISIFHPHEPEGYEKSMDDYHADRVAESRRGVVQGGHEDSPRDRVSDKAGEKHHRDKKADKAETNMSPSYKPGASAFNSAPKVAHGFGHKEAHKKGQLRVSGHAGAHQIGKKK
jgi:hypothetical protein